jgi:hypothetical protein
MWISLRQTVLGEHSKAHNRLNPSKSRSKINASSDDEKLATPTKDIHRYFIHLGEG